VRLEDRDDLWQPRFVLTVRKDAHLAQCRGRKRHAGGAVLALSALKGMGAEGVPGADPSTELGCEASTVECKRQQIRALGAGDGGQIGPPASDLKAGRAGSSDSADMNYGRTGGWAASPGEDGMSGRAAGDAGDVPPTMAGRIDEACDRFEAAW